VNTKKVTLVDHFSKGRTAVIIAIELMYMDVKVLGIEVCYVDIVKYEKRSCNVVQASMKSNM
jgi:hypothetical protein